MQRLIGLDIGGTNIKAALIEGGKIVRRRRFPTFAKLGVDTVINQIVKAIDSLGKSAWVGIGIAGLIDSDKGIVHFSPNLYGWHEIKLSRILQTQTGKSVKILNDVNAITLGEWKFGAGIGAKNLFCFTLGTGVGGGVLVDGKLVVGKNGMAGEFGHTSIDFGGLKCRCGNTGCLERYVGAEYIVELARRKMASKKTTLRKYRKLTPKLIAQEAKHDKIARDVFKLVGFYVGSALVNIIHLLDPEIIVMSGGIARAGRILFQPINEVLRERVMNFEERRVKIVPGRLGDDAGVLGAAYFAQIAK